MFSVNVEKEIKIGGDRYIDTIARDDTIVEKYAKTGRFSIRKLSIGRNGLYILDMLSKYLSGLCLEQKYPRYW